MIVRKVLLRFLWLAGLVVLPATTLLAMPATLDYSGELPEGQGPTNGRVDLTLSLYETPSGGLPVWTEIHLGIPVKQGHFRLTLGKHHPLSGLNPARNYYLAIQRGLKMDAPEIGARKLLIHAETPSPARPEKGSPELAAPVVAPVAVSTVPSVESHAASPAPKGESRRLDGLQRRLDAHIANRDIHHLAGKGSRLDADLLDGRDSTFFATREMLETHEQNHNNPHGLTAAQIDVYSRTEMARIIGGLQKRIAALEAKLQYVQVRDKEMHITGANLHIENGSGATSGEVNGLGNLIIGYQQKRNGVNVRTGSHNLIIGDKHNYSSYGGFVAGFRNEVSGPYASVCGGSNNTAAGIYTTVTGGRNNTAKGSNSSVSGGIKNITIGEDDWAAGGLFQTQ
ncbi:MAG: hypothetical protein D6790_07105 [Caldilineae bacterium]|nr:MAG: hypothetical protein D6790_07105 [Caldilineae bacterium]